MVVNRNLSVAIEEHRSPNGEDELMIAPVLDALFTPAFLADRRIVVLRDAEHLDASQAAELAARLAEPFAPNVLVLAVVGKALPAALVKVVKARGREIDTSPGSSSKARAQWLAEQLQTAPVHLDPAARHLLETHLGEDVSRLHALLDVLTAAYGEGGRVTPAELEPFLGEEGGAPPWDLTDALDNGDVKTSVLVARRLLGPGGRHPFQLLATLHKHYGAMLRLDGSGITDPGAAATLLDMSPYPARKVLAQGRRLGADRIARALSLVADADLDLRGVVEWPNELVIEVLVARLAQLARTRLATPSGAQRPARAP
jgi:DNA polymerase-3 subunit delta